MSGHEIHCPMCQALLKIPGPTVSQAAPSLKTGSDAASSQPAPTRQPERPSDRRWKETPLPLARSVSEPIEDEAPPRKTTFPKKELPKDDMDMTPMVDVTFLLLIFFMITASFTTEKALQQQVASDQPSSQPPPDEESETIKILVDEFNAYTVIFPDGGESEATSKQELIQVLKLAELDGSSEEASSLIIEAHEDSIHAAVVAALDAGRQNNLTKFKVNVVENFD
jgi:biopolymer transport protein ExbD